METTEEVKPDQVVGVEEEPAPSSKPISHEELEEYLARERKKGVLYVSRVPPYMKPEKLRHLFSQYSEILRIYLRPEDEETRTRRKKFGGKRKKKYVDGWVEFKEKREAKRVAEWLNSRPVGGKKLSRYHDDLWSLRYLPHFKWSDLVEELREEDASLGGSLRAEAAAAKRENEVYLEKVERAKHMERREMRKTLKNRKKEDVVAGEGEEDSTPKKPKRTFRQKPMASSVVTFDGLLMNEVFRSESGKEKEPEKKMTKKVEERKTEDVQAGDVVVIRRKRRKTE